jgi:hypothetical protein
VTGSATWNRITRVLVLGTLVFVALVIRADRAEAAVATQSAAAQHCFAGP